MPGTVPIAAGHADYSEGKGFLYMFFLLLFLNFCNIFYRGKEKVGWGGKHGQIILEKFLWKESQYFTLFYQHDDSDNMRW